MEGRSGGGGRGSAAVRLMQSGQGGSGGRWSPPRRSGKVLLLEGLHLYSQKGRWHPRVRRRQRPALTFYGPALCLVCDVPVGAGGGEGERFGGPCRDGWRWSEGAATGVIAVVFRVRFEGNRSAFAGGWAMGVRARSILSGTT